MSILRISKTEKNYENTSNRVDYIENYFMAGSNVDC